MEIRLKAVAQKLYNTKKSGDAYTRVQNETGDWINVMGDFTSMKKGDVLRIKDPKHMAGGLWAFPEDEQSAPPSAGPGQQPAPEPIKTSAAPYVDPNRKTFQEYEDFVRSLATLAQEVLPDQDSQAIAAIIDTGVIAFLNGKITMGAQPGPEEEIPF